MKVSTDGGGVDSWWVDELVCVQCQARLTAEADQLRCTACGQEYPIVDGIPIMLPPSLRKDQNDFDLFYGTQDYDKEPYGHSPELIEWRRRPMFTEIARRLELQPGNKMLDDGGGFGYMRRYLRDDIEYYNLDFSLAMLKKDSPTSRRCVGIGERLPFADNTFDRIGSHHVLEHVDNRENYLREVFRVLKPGGRFVVNTPREQWYHDFVRSRFWWLAIIDESPIWVVKNILYFIKHFSPKFVQDAWTKWRASRLTPHSMRDIPVDEWWLERTLREIGFNVVYKTRVDNRPHGLTGPYWRRFADKHIDASKYGFCVLLASEKPSP